MDLINYLASDNYIIVNKALIKALGLTEAIMIGELCTEYNYWKKQDKLEDDMFYSTIENVEENTGLTAYEQRAAIKSLENVGVLTVTLKGVPAKRYFRLDIYTVVKILTSSSEDFSQLDVKKLNSNNNKNSNKKNNKTISKDIVATTKFSVTDFIETPKKKKNLYEQCVDLINEFTDDEELRYLLRKFLNVCLENSRDSGQPFYKNTFKGKLNNLSKLSDEVGKQIHIVCQTLDNGWAGFYELKEDKPRRGRTGDTSKDIENLTGGLNQKAEKGDIKGAGPKF